ncbi:MAG: DUF3524 domain-containing protein [Desulfobacterales bacterium]|nr:DUF3524 domain-containing protein [Desulfobacterales bacterium]
MKILFLEPFYGGSHKDFADGLVRHSAHDMDLVTLPPRFWKWRMRGAALEFYRRIPDLGKYDAVLASDMMDLTDFMALYRGKCPPVVLYFHENQLSYPLAPGEKRDFHLGFTNVVSAFAADRVLFNSQFHRDCFFDAARKLARQMPDGKPGWLVDALEEKSRILYPGCRFSATAPKDLGGTDPLIVWNHRWEYDKNPDAFFAALDRLKAENVPFQLAVLGEQYDKSPAVFQTAKRAFRDELVAWGYAPSREDYLGWLKKGRIVVSTAVQENFGISVVEAVRHGCFPLLPRRLSYPEIMPASLHPGVLYDNEDQLVAQLKRLLGRPTDFQGDREILSDYCSRYSWEILSIQYDNIFNKI